MKPFDSMIRFPITRARLYEHDASEDPAGATIIDLEVDVLAVDVSHVERGTVTIATAEGSRPYDTYGTEFDFSPATARALGDQLIRAAALADQVGAPAGDGDQPRDLVETPSAAAESVLGSASGGAHRDLEAGDAERPGALSADEIRIFHLEQWWNLMRLGVDLEDMPAATRQAFLEDSRTM